MADPQKALIDYLMVMISQRNWREVSKLAMDLRELELKSIPLFKPEPLHVEQSKSKEPDEIRVTDVAVPHNIQEVVSVLKMSDTELIDKIFPLPEEFVSAN